jgi:hypothetical protein
MAQSPLVGDNSTPVSRVQISFKAYEKIAMLPFGTSRLERVKNSGTAKLFSSSIPHYFVVLLSILRWYEASLSLSSHILQTRGEIFQEYSIASQCFCEIGYYFQEGSQAIELLGSFRAYSDVGDHMN